MADSMLRTARHVIVAGVCAALLLAAGCSGEFGYSRSVFQGKVVDRSAPDIESFAGKPDAVDNLTTGEVVWTFNKRTFDSENANANDASVKVTLKKDPQSGALTYSGIDFLPM